MQNKKLRWYKVFRILCTLFMIFVIAAHITQPEIIECCLLVITNTSMLQNWIPILFEKLSNFAKKIVPLAWERVFVDILKERITKLFCAFKKKETSHVSDDTSAEVDNGHDEQCKLEANTVRISSSNESDVIQIVMIDNSKPVTVIVIL